MPKTKAQRDELVRQGAERRLAKKRCECGHPPIDHDYGGTDTCLMPRKNDPSRICPCPGYKEAKRS